MKEGRKEGRTEDKAIRPKSTICFACFALCKGGATEYLRPAAMSF